MIYEVANLSFNYPHALKKVLNEVSFTLDEGTVFSILGPNGSGKSTLLNCMAGLLKPSKGEIMLCGQEISTMSFREIARVVSYVQQSHTPVFSYTVLHFVTMGRAAKIGLFQKPQAADMQAAWNALKMLGIEHLAYHPYTEISGGERQQTTIARAIVQEPKVILFDEPTAHLDYGNQIRVLRVIKDMAEQGFSVVMTTHNPDHVMLLGGTVAILDKSGHLAVGSYDQVITEERLQEIYKTRIRLIPVPESPRVACIPHNL